MSPRAKAEVAVAVGCNKEGRREDAIRKKVGYRVLERVCGLERGGDIKLSSACARFCINRGGGGGGQENNHAWEQWGQQSRHRLIVVREGRAE